MTMWKGFLNAHREWFFGAWQRHDDLFFQCVHTRALDDYLFPSNDREIKKEAEITDDGKRNLVCDDNAFCCSLQSSLTRTATDIEGDEFHIHNLIVRWVFFVRPCLRKPKNWEKRSSWLVVVKENEKNFLDLWRPLMEMWDEFWGFYGLFMKGWRETW